MITVEPMGRLYDLVITEGDEKISFTFTQLSYFARNKVASLSTSYSGGELRLDVGLTCFYNIKFALKSVDGLVDPDGNPYKLEFEKGLDELTDKCVNELLALPFNDKLIYAAKDIGANVPTKITHPVTGLAVAGIEVVPQEKLKGTIEKK